MDAERLLEGVSGSDYVFQVINSSSPTMISTFSLHNGARTRLGITGIVFCLTVASNGIKPRHLQYGATDPLAPYRSSAAGLRTSVLLDWFLLSL
jgi:hypothetical protein